MKKFLFILLAFFSTCQTMALDNDMKWYLTSFKESDLDGDGKVEIVKLYANIEKNEEGEFLLDDGESWRIEICREGKTIFSHEQYIQYGSAKFFISDKKKIIFLIDCTDSFEIREITFNHLIKKFKMKTKEIINKEDYSELIFSL